jgi:hypothetical protein
VNCNKGIRILNSSKVQVYQNTFYNSLASFERTERSAAGDHFGWHPSAGPDVDERVDHAFVNNLLAADERFKGPLVSFWQSAAVKDRLKDSQVREMDGNVYVRRAGAAPQPLIAWSPAENEKGSTDVSAIEDFRKLQPKFEAKAQVFADYWGPLFRSPELGHFELLTSFAGATNGVQLPAHVRELIKLKQDAKPFPGAYSPGL